MDTKNTIAVEDLLTAACETFVLMLSELGCDSVTCDKVNDWYMKSNDDDSRRVMSEKMLLQIENDTKEEKEKK